MLRFGRRALVTRGRRYKLVAACEISPSDKIRPCAALVADGEKGEKILSAVVLTEIDAREAALDTRLGAKKPRRLPRDGESREVFENLKALFVLDKSHLERRSFRSSTTRTCAMN